MYYYYVDQCLLSNVLMAEVVTTPFLLLHVTKIGKISIVREGIHVYYWELVMLFPPSQSVPYNTHHVLMHCSSQTRPGAFMTFKCLTYLCMVDTAHSHRHFHFYHLERTFCICACSWTIGWEWPIYVSAARVSPGSLLP